MSFRKDQRFKMNDIILDELQFINNELKQLIGLNIVVKKIYVQEFFKMPSGVKKHKKKQLSHLNFKLKL